MQLPNPSISCVTYTHQESTKQRMLYPWHAALRARCARSTWLTTHLPGRGEVLEVNLGVLQQLGSSGLSAAGLAKHQLLLVPAHTHGADLRPSTTFSALSPASNAQK